MSERDDKLVEALNATLALLDKATPGELLLATSCSWRRIQTTSGQKWLTPCVDRDGHPNMDTIENAEAAVAAVNFLRQYGCQAATALAEARANHEGALKASAYWHDLYRKECRLRQDDAARYGQQLEDAESFKDQFTAKPEAA